MGSMQDSFRESIRKSKEEALGGPPPVDIPPDAPPDVPEDTLPGGGTGEQTLGSEIVNRIEGTDAGNYQANWLTGYLDDLRRVKGQLDAGDITMDDYMGVLDEVAPRALQIYSTAAQSGAGGADATKGAGEPFLKEFYNKYLPQRDAKDLLGRYLEPEELARVEPTYATDGELAGRGRIADLFEREKQDPDITTGPDEGDPGEKGTPAWAGQKVSDIFESILGRPPEDNELQHYGALLIREDNPYSPFQLQQGLKQTDEYRKAEDTTFRGEVADELAAPTQEFVEKATPGIMSKFKRAGATGSSGLDFAITNMLEDLAKNREQYLGGLTVDQYGGRKDVARQDYTNTLNQLYAQGAYGQQRQDFLSDAYRNRFFDVSDYNRQSSDYQNYLNNFGGGGGGGNNNWMAPVGQLAGMGAGAYFSGGNPYATAFGGQAVRGVGELASYWG